MAYGDNASSLTVTQASGLLKPVFGKLETLLSDGALLQKKYKLAEDVPLVGDRFEQPVLLRPPQGHSYAGSGGNVSDVNDPRAGKTEPAKVTPFLYLLTDWVSYSLFDRAKQGGQQAFVSAAEFQARALTLSARNNLEIQLLHGREGIGTVNAAISSHVITLTTASLSPGILSQLEGALIDVFQSDLSTKRALNLIVSAVDVDAGTVTVIDAGMTGAHSAAEDDSGVTSTDVLFFAGALSNGGTFNEMYGIGKQLSASTGTYFNIDKASYNLWRASTMTSVGEFTPTTLVTAATKAMNRGFAAGKLLAIMAPRAWGVLNSALMVNEMWTDGKATMKRTGAGEIEVQVGAISIECMAHPFQKQGQCYVIPEQWFKRIGSVDLTFKVPGRDDEYLEPIQGKTGCQMQCRADFQGFVEKPAWAVHVSGITYS